tara:strand:- start:48 stop:278 length:231 start_codon:yes stop_codon:yes gene_type:complete
VAAPQITTHAKPGYPPSMSRKMEVTPKDIGRADNINFRGEYISDKNPHIGLENAFRRVLRVQARAAIDTDNPDSCR